MPSGPRKHAEDADRADGDPAAADEPARLAGRDAPNTDGTKAGIVAGTTYTVDKLFAAMLVMSANNAAVALADAKGGRPGTLAQMNSHAAQLQAATPLP